MNDSSGAWEVCAESHELRPTLTRMRTFLAENARSSMTDELYQFTFPHLESESVFVHKSRLLSAGGPLAALARPGFAEGASRVVELCDEDDRATFMIVRAFLYCDVVQLGGKGVAEVVRAVSSAHRWQLGELFEALCRYIVEMDLVGGGDDVLLCAKAMELPEVPGGLVEYFWRGAAEYFGELMEGKGEGEVQTRLCPKFPRIWDVALGHGDEVIVSLVRKIRNKHFRWRDEGILQLVLEYLEPRIEDDGVVVSLIDAAMPAIKEREQVLQSQIVERDLSRRAIKLGLQSLLAARNAGMTMSWTWSVSLTAPTATAFILGPVPAPATMSNAYHRHRGGPQIYENVWGESVRISVSTARMDVVQIKIAWNVGWRFCLILGVLEMDLAVFEGSCFCDRSLSDGRCDGKLLHCLRHQTEISSGTREAAFAIPEGVMEEYDARHEKGARCLLELRFRVRAL